jgi:hypothetical protein
MTSPNAVQLVEEAQIATEHTDPGDGQGENLKPDAPKPEILPPQSAPPTRKQQPQWEIHRLPDALKDTDSPPWVIQDLVMSGTLTLVSAHPHGMKSLSWLAACMEGVKTGKVFRHFEAPNLRNVLFIETEDPEWLVKKRIQGLAKGLKLSERETLPGFHYTCPGPFELIKQEAQLERLIEEYKLDLIVLSTLQNLLGGKNWKEQSEMADVMSMLVRLARKCPIVLLSHSPQDRSQKRAIGTITVGANCATHIHSEKSEKGGSTYVHLTVDSKAGATETDFSLMLHADPRDKDPVGSVRGLVYAGKGNRGKTKEQQVREAIADNPEATVPELVEIAGCDESYVRRIQRKVEKEQEETEEKKAA